MSPTLPLVPFALLAAAALAQGPCIPFTLSAGSLNGTDGPAMASVRWDPDGPGPLGEQLVVAGNFRALGGVATSVAMLDEATGTWTGLARCDAVVRALAVAPNDDLVIGGDFLQVDGVPMQALARFDGTNWQGLGQPFTVAGINSVGVNALAVLPNGDLAIGGRFASVGGVVATSLARFDGSAWHALGDPTLPWSIGSVSALAVLPSGELVAGGLFAQIGGVAAPSIASWNGTGWSPIGPASTVLTIVHGLQVAPTGEIYCYGPSLGGLTGSALERVAMWNGSSWQALSGIQGNPTAALLRPSGSLLLAGAALTIGPVTGQPLAEWTGSAWQPVTSATLDGAPSLLAEFQNGDLLVGGEFSVVTTGAPVPLPVGGLARFDGGTWFAVQPGTQGIVHDVLARPGDAHLAVGNLRQIGDNLVGAIAVANGAYGWSAVAGVTGQGPFPVGSWAQRIVQRLDGSYVVSTRNVSAQLYVWFGGGVALPIGSVAGDPELAILPDGDLLVGGSAVYESATNRTFTPLGRRDLATGQWTSVDPGLSGTITAMAVLRDGSVVIGGDALASSGSSLGHLARWNGVNWDLLQGGLDAAPTDLAATRDGGFVAIGPFTMAGGTAAGGIAHFDGALWRTFGTGFPNLPQADLRTVVELPADGELLVGGRFEIVDGIAARNLARWDGGAWHAVGSGADGTVRRIAVASDGGIAIAGDFFLFDGVVSPRLVTLQPTCFAWTPTLAPGCAHLGTGIGLPLTVAAPPMRGATVRTETNGLPAQALVVAMLGDQPTAVSLALAGLPASGGCVLRLQPIVTELIPASGGRASFAFDIPNVPAVVGLSLQHQMLSVALGAGGTITSVAVTDAVALVVGSVW